ncbi:YaaL family protein [Lacrimispora sp. JR3]|uniref:YaaL family protein n=1 Tax=Lacrimispora sinapis TaxID=3111456 RepID=UPI00374A661F
MKHGTFKKRLTASEEEQRLRHEIECSKTAIDAARNHFEQVVDPTLIDCYIYELNAAQLRYQFLLRRFKSQEVKLQEAQTLPIANGKHRVLS